MKWTKHTFIVLVVLSTRCLFAQDYSLAEVKKVFDAIALLEREQLKQGSRTSLKNVELTESEFNSWIAFRIETEESEIMKRLRFKFLEKNKLEGHIMLDLRGQKIPKILRPVMNLFFGARLETKEGEARLHVDQLFIEGQPVQPVILDLILFIASKVEELEVASMSDWYELPFGIKEIKVHKGKASFYY